ncbi:MAG TPA: M23 family metallopeptidase, partial [Egibacteraceae bacterium]|nr:M23 family metallopeptidase [Egibacteraceae bacterium]
MCRHRTVSALAIAAIVLTMAAPAFPAGAAGLRPDFQVPFPCGEGWKATTYSGHRGVDWNWGVGADDLGKPAVAAAAGVATPKWQSGYGYYVDVDHGGGWVTRYAHLLEDGRANGFVGQGEPVGLVGSTGRSTSPHLHFEQRADGQVVSPMWAEGV